MRYLESFKGDLLGLYGEKRIVSLLFYGSQAFNRSQSRYSDYDFYLLLDSPKANDALVGRDFVQRLDSIDITIQYLDLIEARGWKNFQFGNHGIFFLLHLASAITLHGTNIFQRKLTIIEPSKIRQSLFAQIEEYFWRLNHWFLTIKDEEWLLSQYKKYIIRIIEDILLLFGDISFAEINTLTYQEIICSFLATKGYFSSETKKLAINSYASNTELLQLNKLLHLLNYDYLKIYNNA